MSFAFQAVGNAGEVIAQLQDTPIGAGEQRFNEFGADLRDLLLHHFGHEHEHGRPWAPGHEYRYIVKANGHGGGSVPLSLQMTIEALHVPVPESVDPEPVDPEPVTADSDTPA